MSKPCVTCGHSKADHIYEEGACRPGFECGCKKYVSKPEEKWIHKAAQLWCDERVSDREMDVEFGVVIAEALEQAFRFGYRAAEKRLLGEK